MRETVVEVGGSATILVNLTNRSPKNDIGAYIQMVLVYEYFIL